MGLGMGALRGEPADVAALALAAALTGCSGLVSNTPWLAQADTVGAPVLRDGVWQVTSPTSPCAFDEKLPADAWPDCAPPIVVRGSQLAGREKDSTGSHWSVVPYVLAAGDPLVLQVGRQGLVTGAYEYEWVRVTQLDDKGRAIGLIGWRILCGPPAKDPAAKPARYPGLADQAGDCVADSRQSLIAAAKASAADYPDLVGAHWVRNGSR